MCTVTGHDDVMAVRNKRWPFFDINFAHFADLALINATSDFETTTIMMFNKAIYYISDVLVGENAFNLEIERLEILSGIRGMTGL